MINMNLKRLRKIYKLTQEEVAEEVLNIQEIKE